MMREEGRWGCDMENDAGEEGGGGLGRDGMGVERVRRGRLSNHQKRGLGVLTFTGGCSKASGWLLLSRTKIY